MTLDNKKAFFNSDIKVDAYKAELILKKYGVTASEIENLVISHLKKISRDEIL